MEPQALHTLIARRRSIFPPVFSDEPIPREWIEQILENANWAPTHRKTEPWRFQVFRGPAKVRLADFLAEAYRKHTPVEKYREAKEQKTRKNVLRSDSVIVLILQRDPEERVPEWEEVAALGAAVQNLWLSATAYGLGGYWSTPGTIRQLGQWLDLPEGQSCRGIFYLGQHQMPEQAGQRSPVEEKTDWHVD